MEPISGAFMRLVCRIAARLFIAIALLPLLSLAVHADMRSVAPGWNNTAIQWHDFASGSAIAKATNKPILLIVHTTWCPHCQNYQKQFSDTRIVELAQHYVMVLVDRDIEKELNDTLGPGTEGYVPRTLFLKSDGALRPEIVSAHPDWPNLFDESDASDILSAMQAGLQNP
jgi:protein-disulfide reductase (glutathione)